MVLHQVNGLGMNLRLLPGWRPSSCSEFSNVGGTSLEIRTKTNQGMYGLCENWSWCHYSGIFIQRGRGPERLEKGRNKIQYSQEDSVDG